MAMTEASGASPEQKRPAKMVTAVAKKAMGETLHSRETFSSGQRVIAFVKRVAVHEGGLTTDVISQADLTGYVPGLEGVILHAQIICLDSGQVLYLIQAVHPGGYVEEAAANEDGSPADYTFGEEGTFLADLDDKKHDALTASFFMRYELDYYVEHPELWQSAVLEK